MYENWQLWGTKPELQSKFNIERLKGNLSDMESTKQLSSLISDCYEPDMKILDVGCNVGHYLVGLRKKFPILEYTGVDAYASYINEAKQAFSKKRHRILRRSLSKTRLIFLRPSCRKRDTDYGPQAFRK